MDSAAFTRKLKYIGAYTGALQALISQEQESTGNYQQTEAVVEVPPDVLLAQWGFKNGQ